jgi:hypothetical protein
MSKGEYVDPELRKDVENIDSLLSKNRLDEATTYRGANVEELGYYGDRNRTEAVIDYALKNSDNAEAIQRAKDEIMGIGSYECPQFVSTSRDEDLKSYSNRKIKFITKIRQGTHGIPVEHISQHGVNRGALNEQEVLLNRGTRMIIEKVEFKNGKFLIYLVSENQSKF